MLYFFTVQTMLSGGQIYLISMIKYIFLSLSNVSHCVLRNILRSVFVIYTEPIIKFYLPYVFLMLPSQRQMRTTCSAKNSCQFLCNSKALFSYPQPDFYVPSFVVFILQYSVKISVLLEVNVEVNKKAITEDANYQNLFSQL